MKTCIYPSQTVCLILNLIKSIKDMLYVPEYSGDPNFWGLVKEGIDIVPELIDHLDDTTNTKILVRLFSGTYRIGDISYLILIKIIHDIPIFELAKISQEEYELYGFGVYWNFVRSNPANRIILKMKIKEWYCAYKNKLTWEKMRENLEVVHIIFSKNIPLVDTTFKKNL